jgi:hypothetical protein
VPHLEPTGPVTGRDDQGRPSAGLRTSVRGLVGDVEWLWVAAPLVFSAVVWFPITSNYFFGDDFLNLYQIGNDDLLRYLVTPNGGHVLLTRNTIFYLLWRLFGPHPGAYYWSLLLTHLLNVGLLFHAIRLATRSPRLASFGAALWGTSPINAETLGWYAVYGHVFVGTVLLVILAQATRLANDGVRPSRGTLACWFGLAIMGATSFGTGLGVAVLLPAVLWLWLPADASRRRLWPLAALLVVIPALYLGLLRAYDHLAATHDRPAFQAMVLLGKPQYLLILLDRLPAWGLASLLLGFWRPASLGLVGCEALLAVFLATVLTVMFRQRGLFARRLAACILLLLGTYGAIAVGRAFMLATNLADVLHTASRYQYTGTLVLTLMLCLLLGQAAPALPSRLRGWTLAAWYGLTLVGWGRSAPLDQHDTARTQTNAALATMRTAIESRPPGDPVYIENRVFQPLMLPRLMFPGWAGVFIIYYPANEVEGRYVHFIEQSPAAVEALRGGRRTSTLLVKPLPPAPPPGPPSPAPGAGVSGPPSASPTARPPAPR